MKRLKIKSNTWLYFICFLLGALASYISLQLSFFRIKLELDVPSTIISVIGILIGLFIADSIQRSLNKEQRRHAYVNQKVDSLWTLFNSFCRNIEKNQKLPISELHILNSEVIYNIEYLKQIFSVYDLDCSCLDDLDSKLTALEEHLSNQNATDNVIILKPIPKEVLNHFNGIHRCFVHVMKSIE